MPPSPSTGSGAERGARRVLRSISPLRCPAHHVGDRADGNAPIPKRRTPVRRDSACCALVPEECCVRASHSAARRTPPAGRRGRVCARSKMSGRVAPTTATRSLRGRSPVWSRCASAATRRSTPLTPTPTSPGLRTRGDAEQWPTPGASIRSTPTSPQSWPSGRANLLRRGRWT